ncbi:MAG: MOSC domain-containing protein [Actinomycetota bacterium]
MAEVEAIFIAPGGSEPMQRLYEVRAIAHQGLEGDRYLTHTGFWSGVDECEVTLIEGEALDDIIESVGVHVADGEHRRNIVTRGVRLSHLTGRRFTIGEAVFSYDRPRPPCSYIASITEPGMTRALGKRGGICVRVVASGVLRVGDAIEVEEQRTTSWISRLRSS